jgi:hypothetical protein
MTHDARTTPLPEFVHLRETARQQFVRDLPHLLRNHPGCWVAYHGEQQVGIARHTGELHQVCRQQQLALDELMFFEIVPPDEEVLFGPMALD